METRYVADLYYNNIKKTVDEFGATLLDHEEIYDADIDIYSLCTLVAKLDDNTIPRLKCSIVAGAANNQLKKEKIHLQMLKDRGILYAPDYVINAGGLINVANEIGGYNRERAFRKAEEGIYDTLPAIFRKSETDGVTTQEAALKVTEKRMKDIAKLKNIYLPKKNVMFRRDNN